MVRTAGQKEVGRHRHGREPFATSCGLLLQVGHHVPKPGFRQGQHPLEKHWPRVLRPHEPGSNRLGSNLGCDQPPSNGIETAAYRIGIARQALLRGLAGALRDLQLGFLVGELLLQVGDLFDQGVLTDLAIH
jgi:hypothetical protein